MAETDLTIGSQSVLPPFAAALIGLASVVLVWETRRKTRRDLRNLEDHLLRDIGLQRSLADCECSKPFWRA